MVKAPILAKTRNICHRLIILIFKFHGKDEKQYSKIINLHTLMITDYDKEVIDRSFPDAFVSGYDCTC